MVCAFNEGTGTLSFDSVSGEHCHTKRPTDFLGFCSGAFEVSGFSNVVPCHFMIGVRRFETAWCFIFKGENVQ
jgi:hypothetical protein